MNNAQLKDHAERQDQKFDDAREYIAKQMAAIRNGGTVGIYNSEDATAESMEHPRFCEVLTNIQTVGAASTEIKAHVESMQEMFDWGALRCVCLATGESFAEWEKVFFGGEE